MRASPGLRAAAAILLGGFLWSCAAGDEPDLDMTTPELIRKEGYPAEAHVVLTDDGYLLTMHRIPSAAGPAVFLQHGLLASSSDWVIAGRGKALAFILAERGYDVWLGNARGNTYSRSHVRYSTSDLRFWNFSWHEMASHDLPAEIAYIAGMKKARLTYIGHSMGTTMFFAMAIDRPESAAKVEAMFALAPVAFMNHLKSPVRLLAPFLREIELIVRYLGAGQFLPQNAILKFLARYGCDVDVTEEKICANSLFVICGFDASQFNYTLMPVILSHSPAGASTKTIVHYGQEITSGRFQRYDYGPKGNLAIYNRTTPPDYDLSKVSVPVGVFWSENDWLASPVDVKRLYDRLPRKILDYKVDYPKFNHLDFLWALDAPKLVYAKLLSAMNASLASNVQV
ncbi:lipase 3 isoform X2 [Nasonia vitripennis]|uniref:Lipase n=1 Tax=Nasonia vitripennis TaxID=7425 RepID=A0A7M7INJ5_NASVI|nr:lipase 3 isoform X2 [Nasonia vitripennis]